MASRAGISKKIREARANLKTWQEVSNALYDGKIGGAVLSRIANEYDSYWPKDKAILEILDPPKPKPDYRLRPVQCLCTEAEYQEMIQASTRERTEKLLAVDYEACPECGDKDCF